MNPSPTGTVTFLFTDIEGSTPLWEQHPEAMKAALQRHDELSRAVIEARGGYIFKTVGDAFCAAFAGTPRALDAALALQIELARAEWGPAPIRVRMGLHTGMAEERDGDYFGTTVNRVARIMALAHGGQVLLSGAAAELLRGQLPEGVLLRDMGEHRLKGLLNPERIWQASKAGLPSDFPPLASLNAIRNNLPVQLTSFIGREREIAEARRLLGATRLLTLTGAGGTGKTRLSLQVAAEVLDAFPDGVWFIELAPVNDPALIAPTIALVIGLSESPGRTLLDEVKDYLRDRQLLLILDNFEQVVAGATTVRDMLTGAPRVRVLVSSRTALRVSGEQEYAVPLLSLPDPERLPSLELLTQYEAVRLFMARAQAVKADFVITVANAPAIAEICYRLDGLPLAIELAAARVRLLSPQSMLSQLSNRLKFLTSAARDLPRRQQTLRGAIDWSYDLLDANEQTLFRRLSVFVGGATFEAIEAVGNPDGVADALGGVEALVDKSLLRQSETRGETRFMMLEVIREYAREKLEASDEAATVRDRHLAHYLARAEDAEQTIYRGQLATEAFPLEAEQDNVRAALDWAQGRDPLRALRLGAAAFQCWMIWGASVPLSANSVEGVRLLTQMLAAAPLPDHGAARVHRSARAVAQMALATMTAGHGDDAGAKAMAAESIAALRALDDRERLAYALTIRGLYSAVTGDLDDARAVLEESLALAGAVGSQWVRARALEMLGMAPSLEPAQYAISRARLEESAQLFQQTGDRFGAATAWSNLGSAAAAAGDFAVATTYLNAALPVLRERNLRMFINMTVTGLADVARKTGDYPQARALYRQLIDDWQRMGNRGAVARIIECLAFVALREGRHAAAARLFGAAEALREASGTAMSPYEHQEYKRELAARPVTDESSWRAAWAEGRRLSPEQAIERDTP